MTPNPSQAPPPLFRFAWSAIGHSCVFSLRDLTCPDCGRTALEVAFAIAMARQEARR